MNLPKYVRIKDSTCCLILNGSEYYRPAGGWSIRYTVDSEGAIRVNEPKGLGEHLHNKILIPTIEENFKESNEGYV